MAGDQRTVWQVAPGGPLQWRFWDDQFVVFHPASGDTHLLDALAGETLRILENAPATADELTDRLGVLFPLPPGSDLGERIDMLLVQFEQLGLIEPVQP